MSPNKGAFLLSMIFALCLTLPLGVYVFGGIMLGIAEQMDIFLFFALLFAFTGAVMFASNQFMWWVNRHTVWAKDEGVEHA